MNEAAGASHAPPMAHLPRSQDELDQYLACHTQKLIALVGRLSEFFLTSPAGIFLTTQSGRLLKANPALAEMLGYASPEELIQSVGDISTDFYQEPSRRGQFKRLMGEEGQVRNFEAEIKCKDGSTRWVSITAKLRQGPEQAEPVYQGFMTDISERKRVEAALAEESLRRKMLIDQAHDGIAVLTPDGRIYECNESFARMLGYSLGEMRELTVWDWDIGLAREKIQANLSSSADADCYVQSVHRRKDGSEFDVEVCINRAEWRGQTMLYCVHRDITDKKRLERESEKIQQQLLLASRQAGMAEVATSVLHNVGNVLNSVNTSISVLKDQMREFPAEDVASVAKLLEENRGCLAAFLTSEDRGDQLINYLQFLGQHLFKRQNAALTELQELARNVDHIKDIVGMQQSYARVAGATETVSLIGLVEDALGLHARALARHDVEICREYEPDLPKITVEKHKVLQILVNLIHNAKYACDASGRADKRITVKVSGEGDFVRAAVSDNGVGIPAANLTKIFSHGFTTREGGHGFGLHSAALAARELGGVLRVQSDGEGQGAIFTLELPAAHL